MTCKAPKGRYWRLSGRVVPPTSGLKYFFFSLSWGVAPGFHRADPLGLNRKAFHPS